MARGATPEATRTLVRNFEDPDRGNATFSATAFWERAWGKPKDCNPNAASAADQSQFDASVYTKRS